ncbi:MAG: hypothetical protein QM791_03905 [Ferruginibacter sp.]
MTNRNRLLYYLLLFVLCMILPYIIMVCFILITKVDDEVGLSYTLLPGAMAVQFVFGLFFIKTPLLPRLSLSIILALLAFGLFALLSQYRLFTTGADSFGLFDLVLYNFLAGIIVWELYFQLNRKLSVKA